jgi:hypothetical protein
MLFCISEWLRYNFFYTCKTNPYMLRRAFLFSLQFGIHFQLRTENLSKTDEKIILTFPENGFKKIRIRAGELKEFELLHRLRYLML